MDKVIMKCFIFSPQTHFPSFLPPFTNRPQLALYIPLNCLEGMSLISLNSTIFSEVKVTGINSCHLRKRHVTVFSVSLESCNIDKTKRNNLKKRLLTTAWYKKIIDNYHVISL